jgi:transposase InsO family protein
VKVNQATHSVGMMCRLLKISRNGFYAWLKRPMCTRQRADLALTGKIEAIHRGSKGVYGSPMIHAELADDHQIRVGRKRVARLTRCAGLRGATLRKFVVTTVLDPQAERAVHLAATGAVDNQIGVIVGAQVRIRKLIVAIRRYARRAGAMVSSC